MGSYVTQVVRRVLKFGEVRGWRVRRGSESDHSLFMGIKGIRRTRCINASVYECTRCHKQRLNFVLRFECCRCEHPMKLQ